MIGGLSSSSMRPPMCSIMAGKVSASIGGGVLAQRLDPALEAWVGRGQHTVALVLVALDPLLPASRGHPEAEDQHDRVGGSRIGGVLGSHGSPPDVGISPECRPGAKLSASLKWVIISSSAHRTS
jgi:hypothetical protein